MDSKDISSHNAGSTFSDGLSPTGGVILAAVIANILADGLNSNQIAALGGFLTIIGDSLGYISAQMDLNDSIK